MRTSAAPRPRSCAFSAPRAASVSKERAGSLRTGNPKPGASVAIVGYPKNGPLRSTPGRIGMTTMALTQDAYGHGPVDRLITAVAGAIEHGDSGGPAIDAAGDVEATIFAARIGSRGGYGVPGPPVLRALDS